MPLTPERNRRRTEQQQRRRLKERTCASPFCGRPATLMLTMKGQSVALCDICNDALKRAGEQPHS